MAGDQSPAVKKLAELGVTVGKAERPTTDDELRKVMEGAAAGRRTLFPVGGGTALGVGSLPDNLDIALDMSGLSNILTLDTKNLNMTVQAGMRIDDINANLNAEGRGFFVPLDPPLADRATIGGVYASNISGPSRLLYGTLRDQALGIAAVDAEGRSLQFGGVTVKNVSGYDLTKFFMGSAGRLCIIKNISFRIYPLPEASSLVEIEMGDQEQAEKLLADLRTSGFVPTGTVVADGGPGSTFRVLTAFEGHPKAVERQNREFLKMAEALGGRGEAHTGRSMMVERLQAAMNPDDTGSDLVTLKISVPIASGIQACSKVRELSGKHGLQTNMALMAGNGVLYAHVRGAGREGLLMLVNGIKETAKELGGHANPVQAPRHVLTEWGMRVDSALERFALRPIKEKLDPKGILLPLS